MHEYELMFSLGESDLRKKILGCGDGPASFNAEMTQRGLSVVSCDPIYVFSPAQILNQFKANIEPVMSQVRAHLQNYVWSYHRSPDDLLRNRETVICTFISDYLAGFAEGRYVVGELPILPFANDAFDLAVCSHLLFLYSNLLPLEFHLRSILELCRVASELRIFPITGLDCQPSPHLPPLTRDLQSRGLRVEIVKVNYQLQRDGDKMMRISK
jgi:SAM-dependent methyltransferase